ncbi:MAG: hypothetical protein ACLRIS_15455 [Flavonifractor plautii]
METAILGARRPAVVLLAGKGCEEAQKRKNGPSPASRTGRWPGGRWTSTMLDKWFAAAGAAAWGGVAFRRLLPFLSTGAREKVETLCPAPETVLVAAFPYYAGERPGNLSPTPGGGLPPGGHRG